MASQECKSGYGKIACGHHCVAAYNDVKCAPTPDGACMAAYGQVVCSTATSARWGEPVVQQECKSGYGKIACGHHCVAAYNDVKCAPTSDGTCVAANGAIICTAPLGWSDAH